MVTKLGRLMRKKFLLEPSEASFLNHGSKGAVPACVQAQRIKYLNEMEAHPGIWFSKTHKELWNKNTKLISKFVGCDPNSLVFVSNATTGVNTILKSLDFKPGDGIVTFTYTHKNVRKTCNNIARRTGAEVLTVDFRPPFNSVEQVVDMYDTFLTAHPRAKLVIIDYISSVPPIKMPLEKLIPVFRKHGLLILVDGAHTPGQVKLNLEEQDIDFYTGNLYKWLHCPRGSAILWSNPSFHDVIQPLATSAYLSSDETFHDFIWQGTVDFTPYFCTEAALKFLNSYGGQDAYLSHCSELADEAAELLVRKFGTHTFPIPREMEAPYMRLIRAPAMPGATSPREDRNNPFSAYGHLPIFLPFWERYKIQSVFLYVHGEPWIRISCNIYNSIDEYERLADCYLQMVEQSTLD